MLPRRFELVMAAVFCSSGALSGCGGGDPSNPSPAEASGGAANHPADAAEGDAVSERHFAIEGRGESDKTSTVFEVVEGEGVSLSITGADAADNVIVISVRFEGVDAVVGAHTVPIGPLDDPQAFATGSVDGDIYQSVGGELAFTISAGGHAEGTFDLLLGRDPSLVPTPSAPSEAPLTPEPIEASLTLSGSFASDWTVTCYSRLRGFTGNHTVADSPFCQNLSFE